MKAEDLKLVVKEKYSAIATQSVLLSQQGCCGTTGCCGDLGISMIGDEYNDVQGHNKDADLGLGCGIPTQFAAIKEGDSVLDLGSGAGNDCFVARSLVGETGKVTGIDFTEAMIEKAKINLEKTGFKNIEFIQGEIEEMPLPDSSFDVVISNCVLNLVPDKYRAFAEIMRVLKPGGHFCVSDVVIKGNLPDKLQKDAEMYAGCVSGALQMNEYLQIIETQDFKNVIIHKQKEIVIPEKVLANYLKPDELKDFQQGETGIYSITISGYKHL
jgi:ubiquinone/menaquinone biosynthesis C-methylase UbiE